MRSEEPVDPRAARSVGTGCTVTGDKKASVSGRAESHAAGTGSARSVCFWYTVVSAAAEHFLVARSRRLTVINMTNPEDGRPSTRTDVHRTVCYGRELPREQVSVLVPGQDARLRQ